MHVEVEGQFDEDTNTVSYIVHDPDTKKCAIIDSVLDFDYSSGSTSTKSANEIVERVRELDVDVEWVLETHVHADHLSAAPYLREVLGGKIGIGSEIVAVQEKFGKVFNEGTQFQRDGSQFDALFDDGDSFDLGRIRCKVVHTPGHTPACITYLIGDAAFCGDTLFMPDFGTARTDFPGGSADDLYDSIQKLLSLPHETRIFVGHDYKPESRDEFIWESTVREQKEQNVHVGHGRAKDDFVKMRIERDESLGLPRLIVPSVQVNMRAGRLPEPEDDGVSYLKVPVNILAQTGED